ncbi:MAG: CHAT domain-containing protein, partial [Candidatus Acidiferrales bacterium]
RGRFIAALVTKDALRMVPLTPVSRVKSMLRMLEFQLAKFRLRGDYVTTFQKPLLEATQSHLRDLYEELLAPLRQWWKGEHLVVVPHGILHYLPFHALYDGNKYLIDECRVTYAPSATVYELCHRKAARGGGGSLVLGVPDPQAPFILEEVQAVASNVPAPELFVGERATAEVLREKGAHSSLIHIAAHGTFREDNPMFSRIRLGQSYLSVYDLYNLDLPAELVTLSGCATGVNVVAAGDELLGLVRGLFSAGAQSLLLTLWDVNDKSTAEFMRLFYGRLRDSGDKAGAVRDAMLELRSKYPHPYYWAPFLLIGKAFQATQ